jgi:hypothetical protein
MRRRLLAFALVFFFAAEALPLLLLPPAWHCYCAVKTACCRMRVCPMDAARRHGGTGLESCGGEGRAELVPLVFRQHAVVPEPASTVASTAVAAYPAVPPAPAMDGAPRLADRPPRVSFLVTA